MDLEASCALSSRSLSSAAANCALRLSISETGLIAEGVGGLAVLMGDWVSARSLAFSRSNSATRLEGGSKKVNKGKGKKDGWNEDKRNRDYLHFHAFKLFTFTLPA